MNHLHILFLLITLSWTTIVSCQVSHISSEKKDGAFVINISGNPIFTYQYETVFPPEGIDSSFQRSGFIHPLNTLNGHTITTIQPPDHYHHYGLWNPWTHVLFEKDTLDFWNLAKKVGTVRFADFKELVEDENSVSFQVLHEHVVLKDGKNKIALNELQTMKVSYVNEEYYTLDLQFDYSCATDSPFKILEYRYGGLCLRGTEEWTKNTSTIVNSEGQMEDDLEGSLARWCMVQGKLGNETGGAIIMSNPKNHNHPEPLRVWPRNQENGQIFINFSPTKFSDWELLPNKVYSLKYRVVIFNDKMSSEVADKLWLDYSKL